MFTFFTPTTKVQKDRAIMRETDARLAKYSRRGVMFNFVAFLLLLASGNFVEKQLGLAIVLTVGLLLVTILRSFFLFRFESLYPRAPAKWRNNYFFATLLGATWWGVILVSVTLVLQMRDEAPLLWLYTVVFFSTTAHAFAPYQRFLAVYQFVGQVPAAVAALFVHDVYAYLYALLLIAFYLMLVHQCRLMSADYWQKLAATYALAKKTENLEEEKRGTRATVQLNQEFMNNLHADLDEVVQLTESSMQHLQSHGDSADVRHRLSAAQDAQARIYSNVRDFHGLLSKELILQARVFNVRHELQDLISEAVGAADMRGIELESALSPTIPMRLQGDAHRFAQIIRTVLASATDNAANCFILLEADFLREFEASGDLQVTVTRQAYSRRRLFQSDSDEGILDSLDLSVCKGLADSMDGTLTVAQDQKGHDQIRFRAKFKVPELNSQIDFHKNLFAGHTTLVIHHNPNLLEVKRRELDALGLSVRTESQYRRAYQMLVNSYRENAPIETVLFYMNAQSPEALEFSQGLLAHKELRHTHQLIACPEPSYTREVADGENFVHTLAQPTGLYELGMVLFDLFSGRTDWRAEAGTLRDNIHILFVDTRSEASDFNPQLLAIPGARVDRVDMGELGRQQLESVDHHLIVMACEENNQHCSDVIDRIRAIEIGLGKTTLLPIIGIGEKKDGDLYELGFDHFIDISQGSSQVETALRYWASL